MAPRKPPGVKPPKVVKLPSTKAQLGAAMTALSKLAQAGTASERMRREVGIIAAGWLAQPEMERERVREQLATMRDELAEGLEAMEEQVSDMDPSEAAAMKQAARTLDALRATRDALTEELAGLAGVKA
jgi:hypothetical protein